MVLKRFPTNSGYLYYGPMPDVKVLNQIKRNKIHTIWNLAGELKMLVPYEETFVPEVIQGNIKDYSVPSNVGGFLSQLNHIVSILRSGKKVFVHCYGGRGRTGMTLAAIKVALDGTDPKEALKMVGDFVNGPDTAEQKKFIEFYSDYLSGKKKGDLPEFPREKPKSVFNYSPYKKWQTNFDFGKHKSKQHTERELKNDCFLCGNPDARYFEYWDIPPGGPMERFNLCKNCDTKWRDATEEERDGLTKNR